MFQYGASASGRAWRRVLTGGAIVAIALLLMPAPAAQAAGPSPTVSVGSTSYSNQARPYKVRVVNRVAGARVVARLTNSPNYGDSPMACTGSTSAGSTWTCSASGRPLNIGSITVRAQSVHPTDPSKSSPLVTRSASVSSSFSAGGPGSVDAGDSYAVTGRYDHLSGINDNRVTARVTAGGGSVTGCSTSGTSYRCTVRTSATATGRISVQVSQSGTASRSRTVSTSVAGAAAPVAPAFDVPGSLGPDAGPLTISGTAGRAGLSVQIAVDDPGFSTVAASCTSIGSSGAFSCTLPSSLSEGTHTIYARSRDAASGQTSVFSSRIVVVATNTPSPTPTPTKAPTKAPATVAPVPVTPTPSPSADAAPQPEGVIEPIALSGDLGASQDALVLLLVLGLAVITLARPGPLALVRRGGSVSFSDVEEAEIEAASTQTVGFGDHSGTWAFAGHDLTDEFSRKAPENVAPWSPFLGRVLADGVELRAMLGTLWWLSPLGGLVLGFVSAQQVEWQATVPPTGLVLIVLVLAAFDAFAGFLAALAFGLFTIGNLGPDAGHGLLVLLALGVLWSSLPLVANALRPMRRHGTFSWQYLWDRMADAVIPALVNGWLAWAVAASFDLITGAPSSITDNAATVGWVAAGATVARVLLDQAAAFFWPERLRQVGGHDDLPTPRSSAVLGGVVLRVALFAFAGHVIIGSCWQLYVGVALFALPDVLALIDNRLGWSFSHKFLLPVGITAVVSLVVVGSVLVTIAVADAATVPTALRSAFLAASLAPALLGVAQTFDGSTRRAGSTWTWQLAGLAVVAVGTALALQGWNF